MTAFENIKAKNIEELAEWLDEYCMHDTAPWISFWDEKYCHKCESIELDDSNEECAYCEINGNCKFFKELKNIPDNKQIIKMWLESEAN